MKSLAVLTLAAVAGLGSADYFGGPDPSAERLTGFDSSGTGADILDIPLSFLQEPADDPIAVAWADYEAEFTRLRSVYSGAELQFTRLALVLLLGLELENVSEENRAVIAQLVNDAEFLPDGIPRDGILSEAIETQKSRATAAAYARGFADETLRGIYLSYVRACRAAEVEPKPPYSERHGSQSASK